MLSPALSQVANEPAPSTGRKIGVIADAGSDLNGIGKLRKAAEELGAFVLVIAAAGGLRSHGGAKGDSPADAAHRLAFRI